VNPNLAKLHPYPFERLRLLFKDITPDARYSAINLGIGEPKHPTPEFIRQALTRNLSGVASYPATAGDAELMRAFLLYRTYHGSAMALPAHAASVAAWDDETNVAENRRPMENTACIALSSSNAWMPRRAPRPVSMSCCAAIRHMRRAAELRARARQPCFGTDRSDRYQKRGYAAKTAWACFYPRSSIAHGRLLVGTQSTFRADGFSSAQSRNFATTVARFKSLRIASETG
jgi:hypothetical protein